MSSIGQDPRHYQIAALGALLAYGMSVRDFQIGMPQVLVIVISSLATQYLATRWWRPGTPDLRSPLITALSLCLLLRVDSLVLAAAAAALAVSSKFGLRVAGRHLFNPTAFAIAVLVLGTDHAWVSPGQWGHTALAGIAMAGAGALVLTRARRLDVCLAFLLAWGGTLVIRGLWLGDPPAIAMHQLSNGALLLFAFFMITDPRTTPSSRRARLLFAGVVSLAGAAIVFGAYRADGLILALALCGPLVPLLDRTFPGATHRWGPPMPDPDPLCHRSHR